jgi:hypothetical protein
MQFDPIRRRIVGAAVITAAAVELPSAAAGAAPAISPPAGFPPLRQVKTELLDIA